MKFSKRAKCLWTNLLQGEEVKVSAFTAVGEFIGEQTLIKGVNNIVDFDFNPAIVTGIVTENGSPLEGAKVYAGFNNPFFTNASVEYAVKVKSGFTRVFAYTGSDEFIGEKMVTLAEGEATVANFDFNPATITGTISKEGVPVPLAQVYVGANMPIMTDTIGQYTTRVQSGTWKIFAENSSTELIGETTIQVVSQDTIVVNLP